MKLKHVLALAGLLIGVGSLQAQTNLLSRWDGGTNTNSPSEFGWTSSAGRTLQKRDNGSGIRMMTTYSGYKLEDGTAYTYAESSDPSSVIFWVRYNTAGESFTYTFQGLEADTYYDFSGLVGWHNNSSNPTMTVVLNDGTNTLATMSKAVSAKQTLYAINSRFKTPSTMTTTTNVKIVFTCSQTGDCMEAVSALSLVKVDLVLKDDLEAAIAYATVANTYLSNSDLTTAIATAQGVYDEATATQTDVNDAVTALYAAASTAVNANPLTLINPGFEASTAVTTNILTNSETDRSLDYTSTGWVLTSNTNGNFSGNSCSAVVAYGGSGQINGANAPSADNANNSGNALGFSLGWGGVVTYQTVSAVTLPMGYYTLTVYGNNQLSGKTQFKSLNGFVPTSGTSHLSSKTSFAYNTWVEDVINFTLTEDTEGKIQIGGQAISGGSGDNGKVFFDNITLSYKSLETAWPENKAAAQDVLDDATYAAITGAERTAVTTAMAATPSTAAEYETAFTNLENAVNAFTASVGDYTTLAAEQTKATALGMTAEQIAAVVSTSNTAIVNTQALMVAEYNYVTTNYSHAVELGTWHASDNAGKMTGQHWDGTNTSSYLEQGGDDLAYNLNSWTVTYDQTLSLPAGNYIFKVAGRTATDHVTINLNVTDVTDGANPVLLGTVNDFPKGNVGLGINKAGATSFDPEDQAGFAYNGKGRGWQWRYVKFTLANPASVKVEVRAEADAQQRWMGFCNATVQTDDADNVALMQALVALNDAKTAATLTQHTNVGTGVFQYEATNDANLWNAYSTAKSNAEAFTLAANTEVEEVTALTTALTTAQANYSSNAVINAPDASKRYNVSIVDDGQAWDGNAITFIAGGRTDMGNFTVKYLASANAYMCQALKFTAVEGEANTYKISAIRADGGEQYLTTGSAYEGGNNTQIRTTDDASKASWVKIQPAATSGQFQLLNVSDGNKVIGRNATNPDNGMYTDGNVSFTIAEASQASVTVSCKADKFGTTIVPFTVDITEFSGIKFYTVESVNATTGKVQLTDVTALAANVPYLIKNEGGENFSKDVTGWGTATADSYTEGLLTGVYTAATIPASDGNTTNYVLQTPTEGDDAGVQAFYKVAADFTATAYKCYLTVTSETPVKAFFLGFGGEDAINGIEAETENAEIFNLAGQRVNKAQRGIYIVNGKKVLVK